MIRRPGHTAKNGGSGDAYSARLRARREELRGLSESARDSRKPVELDQSKVGRPPRLDALRDQAMAQGSERRRAGALRPIRGALARLEGGGSRY